MTNNLHVIVIAVALFLAGLLALREAVKLHAEENGAPMEGEHAAGNQPRD